MADSSEWDDLVAGKNCPFCAPREDKNKFSVKIRELSVSTLYLSRSQLYRGYCTLVFEQRHVTGLERLSDEEYQSFANDLRKSMVAIFNAVKPDHMNYATLGNSIPHLHYHIIPRYKDDPCWRTHACSHHPAERTDNGLSSEAEYDKLVVEIQKRF